MKLQKIAGILFIIFMVVAILILAKTIIIPLILAVFLWFLIKELRDFMDKSNWIKSSIPRWVKTLLASLFLIMMIGLMANLLISNVESLAGSLNVYEENLDVIAANIESNYGIDLGEKISNFNGELDFQEITRSFLDSISELFSNAFLIILYLIFILMEESTFVTKLKAIYPTTERYQSVNQVLYEIDYSLSKYISIKTLLSFITASASFIALWAIGIDFALFWAFFIFILNYIPSIGSLIATLFPALMAIVQYGGTDFTPFILVLVFVGLIQIIVGNFLEPKMMGNSLNISSLVVILSLSVWGAIWGIVGMVLSVPITVMMILMFSHFQSTKNIAIVLSEKGLINSNKNE